MTEPVLSVRGMRRRFGGVVAVRDVDLDVRDGEVHAVIGANGSGKTTLLRMIFGEVQPDAGRVVLAGRDVSELPVPARVRAGIGRAYQISSNFRGMSTADNVAFGVRAGVGIATALLPGAAAARHAGERTLALLARVGLGKRADDLAEDLSHGEHRQLELAMALATGPRVLLLDEPFAGLGSAEALFVRDLIRGAGIAVLMVEHDLDAVFAIADRVTVLARGEVVASGDPAAVRADPAARESFGNGAAP
ncbi:MAG: ABC transporter ATP-binding protein [Proteobacteria bacterium]|nr:ABC transporter ATP-binding protein [Pseudomonadota bacterium]MDA1132856.1 ABC transporter ATP-binding protein [Pseudomonadota bacterium]